MVNGKWRRVFIYSLFTIHHLPVSCLRENLRGLAHVAGGGGDDCARADVDFLALLYGASHVVLADEVNGLAPVRLRAGSLRRSRRLGRLRADGRALARRL